MSDNNTNYTLAHLEQTVKEAELEVFKELKRDELLSKANTLPQKAGCYLMKNSHGEIIYVGKAKKLKSRVQSYFNNSTKSPKTEFLVGHVKNFSFIITKTEAESYILENNLIKKYKPKYNIRLKDDKSYPYVAVDLNHAYPKLSYIRRPKKNKNQLLFGPYPTGSNISSVLRTLTRAFMLRDCSDYEFRSRKEPCLLYQMGFCSGSCAGLISEDDYRRDLEMALDVFRGEKKAKLSLDFLREKMFEYAREELFEKAASLRDMIDELEEFSKASYKQNVEFVEEKNIDLISYYVGESELDISLYMIRHGALLGFKNFHFPDVEAYEDIESEIITFMTQYYSDDEAVMPELIVTSFSDESSKLFGEILNSMELSTKKIQIRSKMKKYESLLESTYQHAVETQRVRLLNQESEYVGLDKLKDLLKLKVRPRVLECYDIAIWQGKSPTASKIVFHDGKPDKKKYRHYNLMELPEGNNDFFMMKEVISRRLKKGDLPDVFVIDGGVGQVNSVIEILKEFKIDLPVVGIAEARDLTKGNLFAKETSRSEERLVIPGRANPYILKKNPSLFKIMVSMRNEAHRFSRRLHHKKEKERVFHSWLDEVPYIGEETKHQILKNLTLSKEELREFNVSKLKDFLGINLRQAKSLYEYLHAKK